MKAFGRSRRAGALFRPGVLLTPFLVLWLIVVSAGSGGDIRLRSDGGDIKFSPGNFLVRVRGDFVKRGIVTAVIDVPFDQRAGWGMSDEFRFGKEHLIDVQAVIADLGKRFPGLPIFLVGTSRGSISAASLGARLDGAVAGVVLTSSMFRASNPRAREPGPGLSRFDFGTIKVPVLIVHHREDACPVSSYGDGEPGQDVPTCLGHGWAAAHVRRV